MARSSARTPIEELEYRVRQYLLQNPGWEIHTLNLKHLEAALVKHDTYVPRHQSLPPHARHRPTPREQWRRIWIDPEGHWHSKPAAPPGVTSG